MKPASAAIASPTITGVVVIVLISCITSRKGVLATTPLFIAPIVAEVDAKSVTGTVGGGGVGVAVKFIAEFSVQWSPKLPYLSLIITIGEGRVQIGHEGSSNLNL